MEVTASPVQLEFHPGRWQSEELFFEGDTYYQRLISDISRAEHSIDLEVYIFEPDAVGEKIMQALVKACQRGVHVRVLVDGVGSPRWLGWFRRRWRTQNFEARVYRPLPWPLSSFSLVRTPTWRNIVRFFSKVNRRNHRKSCIIDENIAYVGSFNFSIVHSWQFFGELSWRDTAVRLEGDGLPELHEAFEWSWRRARKPRWQDQFFSAQLPLRLRYIYTGLVRLNYLWALRKHFTQDLLNRIARAQFRVWLTNPYFVPNRKLMRALVKAAKRGIDVKILVPRKSDVKIVRYASTALYGRLIPRGVRIFEYLPSFLHAKVMIVDDWLTVGSSNLNYRSLLHDLEVDAVVGQDISRELLIQKFHYDLNLSEQMTYEKWTARNFWQKLLERIALLLKYWI